MALRASATPIVSQSRLQPRGTTSGTRPRDSRMPRQYSPVRGVIGPAAMDATRGVFIRAAAPAPAPAPAGNPPPLPAPAPKPTGDTSASSPFPSLLTACSIARAAASRRRGVLSGGRPPLPGAAPERDPERLRALAPEPVLLVRARARDPLTFAPSSRPASPAASDGTGGIPLAAPLACMALMLHTPCGAEASLLQLSASGHCACAAATAAHTAQVMQTCSLGRRAAQRRVSAGE